MLGDLTERALALVGIDQARVERWLGQRCNGCKRRKEKLNALGNWALRTLKLEGGGDSAVYLESLLDEPADADQAPPTVALVQIMHELSS